MQGGSTATDLHATCVDILRSLSGKYVVSFLGDFILYRSDVDPSCNSSSQGVNSVTDVVSLNYDSDGVFHFDRYAELLNYHHLR